jgi:hypothetical protein
MYKLVFLIFGLFGSELVFSQELFLPNSNENIDLFLDELSTNHIVELNSVIKPYSRVYIAEKLKEAAAFKDRLSKREQNELAFYMADYSIELQKAGFQDQFRGNPVLNPDAVQTFSVNPLSCNLALPANNFTSSSGIRKPPVYSLSIRPLLESQFFLNEKGTVNTQSTGTGLSGYLGKHLGFAFSISKGFQSEILADTFTFTRERGEKWNRYANGGADYVEWTGQVIVSWKWGSFGIIKDRFEWGNNYNGPNIFFDKAPAFPRIQLHIKPAKWIEFTYFHAWLASGLIDSNRTFVEHHGSKTYYHRKFLAANLLTVTPWKYLNISFGNSVVYSDNLQPGYLIPVLFYKSLDHTLYPVETSTGLVGDNAQMFFDISSRQIKHLHLFLTLFVDELNLSRILKKDQHNFLSWKAGFNVSDFPFTNLSLIGDWVRTLPMTYQHNIPLSTFTSDGFNLGNYLRDNSQEFYFCLSYKPIRGLHINLIYDFAQHGDNWVYGQVPDPAGLTILQNITWQNATFGLSASYELLSNAVVSLSYEYSHKKGTNEAEFDVPLFIGNTNTISLAVNIGF